MTTASPAAAEKLDFKRILPIFIIVLIDLLGLTIIIPLLPLYAASFGANPLVIGILGAVYPVMQLIGGPLLGGLSDRYGRRPVLIFSQIGTLIGFLLLGVANALPLLFLSRIIDGLTGGNIVVAQAAITDSTTEKTRAQGLGLLGAAFGLGFTLGPAIAGIALAVSNNNYHVPAVIAAAFSLISVLLTSYWFKETLHPDHQEHARTQESMPLPERILTSLRNPLVGVLLVLIFLQQLVFGGFENLLSLFTLSRLGMDAAGNALLFVFVGIIIVMVQGKYIGPWSRKYGERKLIYAGLALLAVGLIITSVTPAQTIPGYSRTALEARLTEHATTETTTTGVTLPEENNGFLGIVWIMVAMIPASIGGGLLSPSINSLITKRTGRSNIGGTLGVSSALVSAANAITPIVGGAMFQYLGSTAPFLLGGLVMGGLYLLSMRMITPAPQDTPVESAPAAS
ncbi:MAG: MFS transporter [Anaerolineae bacterium]